MHHILKKLAPATKYHLYEHIFAHKHSFIHIYKWTKCLRTAPKYPIFLLYLAMN